MLKPIGTFYENDCIASLKGCSVCEQSKRYATNKKVKYNLY